MKNPRLIETIKPGATYSVPTYYISNMGIHDGGGIVIKLCKGNKEDETIFRQEGMFTETLIQVAKQYLEDVNVGDLGNKYATNAILKLEEALMWINLRSEDRKLRGVQGTYRK